MKKNTNISERIKQLIDYLGVTKNEFAKNLGYKRSQSIYDIINGKSKPSFEFFSKLYNTEYSEIINPEWLLTGRGEMLRGSVEPVEPVQVFSRRTDHPVPVQDIPLYDIRGVAGLSAIFNDKKSVPLDTIRIPNLPKVDGAVFITGDNMYPILKSGDIVVLKKINDIPEAILWGEIYLLDIDWGGDDLITVKYVQRSDKGDKWIKLVSQNEHHQPKDIELKKVRGMAHVKASIRFHTMT